MDRMTVTIVLLHSWVFIQKLTPALGDHDFSKNTGENGLDDRSAIRDLATQSHKIILVSISKSYLKIN